jgi:phosphatidylethanolamine-binding protein (PEBP) family uncharacterized protein
MPKRVAESLASRPSNPNCVGENISPQLSWSNVPDGTKSFILLMSDPEGRGGTGSSHFVSYRIAPTVTGFAEGEVSMPSARAPKATLPIPDRARLLIKCRIITRSC